MRQTTGNACNLPGIIALSGILVIVSVVGGGAAADIMPPAPLPTYTAGDVYIYTEHGKQSRSVVDSIDGDLVNFRDMDSSAKWSYFRNFALPTPYWNSNSPKTSGQRFVGNIDTFFPLRIGNVMEFLVEGEDVTTNNSWSYSTRCEVTGNENITVPAGSYNTLRVDCISTEWGWEKTYFYAPVEQILVRLESRAEGQAESVQELVSYQRADH